MHAFAELLIGGTWRPSSGDATIDVVSPSTEQLVGQVPEATAADVDAAVRAAREITDARTWIDAPLKDRVAALNRLAELYTAHLPDMASLITTEVGSPIAFSEMAQAPTGLAILQSTLGLAEDYPWREARKGVIADTTVVRTAVGVVAAIVPWNAPQFIIMAKLAPALLAGCAVIVKPAPEAPLNAMLLAQLVEEAGFPPGLVSVLPAGREVAEYLVRHSGVDKVAFTGSTAAGRRIAALCGEQLKRCTLELGGKSAAVLLEDVDLASTVEGLRFASLLNSGQTCTAQTRILAPRSRYDEIVTAVSDMVGSMRVGDPFDRDTEIGPMVARRQQERVQGYIELGESEGASITVGGVGRPDGVGPGGWYVRPTVFAGVDNSMRIAREEIFGPVLCVIPYDDEADAVRIANDSEYGLAGSVWTADGERGVAVAERIRAGVLSVNSFMADFLAPFGGFKCSGIGRELGREGIDSYVELQAIAPPNRQMFE